MDSSSSFTTSGSPSTVSPLVRTGGTIGLLAYLAVVLLGPLSNPIGSEHLTLPLAKRVRPIHQALFLGHGYRFFGPDPGPSHILEYRVRRQGKDAVETVGRFPDRGENWPRLLYHRWFMLSETLFRECAALPDPADHRRWLASITQEIEAHRQRGELSSMRHLIRQRELRVQDYQISRQRVDELIRSVAWHFLDRNQGDEIELYLLERLIPRPMDIESGVQLTAPRFLSEPRLIGSFTISDFRPRRKIP